MPEKGKGKIRDLSRSCPGRSGLLSSRLDFPFWAVPSSTLDEPIPHSQPRLPRAALPPAMFNDDIYPPSLDKDYRPQPLFVCQPYALQIIQLVECSPPPPQQKYSPSRISSSSSYSSSQSDADAYDSSSESLSDGTSYCSSAQDSAPPVPLSFDNRDPSLDDTYRTRQRRVSLWRDTVYSRDVATPGSSVCPPCVGWFALSHTLYRHRM